MNPNPPDLHGTRWLFVGEDGSKSPTMLRHTVIMADEHEVVTWSDPIPESIFNAGICGYSWLGSPGDFLKSFKPSLK